MKLPRTQQKLNDLLNEAFERGMTRGALEERRKMEEEMKHLTNTANLKCLNEVTNLARATGQTIEAMCRVMYNGKGM